MKTQDSLPPSRGCTGHVRNGVIVLDSAVHLPEGQAVRVEPIRQDALPEATKDREKLLQLMGQTFATWDEEDSQVPNEVAEEFHKSLEENRGLRFHTPKLD